MHCVDFIIRLFVQVKERSFVSRKYKPTFLAKEMLSNGRLRYLADVLETCKIAHLSGNSPHPLLPLQKSYNVPRQLLSATLFFLMR